MTIDHEPTHDEAAAHLEAEQAATPNHFREIAERLTREGKTTFTDARAALDEYNTVQQ